MMRTRREFFIDSLALAGVVALSGTPRAWAATKFPAGLIYTKDSPGRWAGKEAAHAPQVTVAASKISIVTPHPMTAPHLL